MTVAAPVHGRARPYARRTEQLLVIGAGGLGREVAEAVRAVNDGRPTWDLLGFLDDLPGLAGTPVGGACVLGPVDAVADYPDAHLVLTVGSAASMHSRPRLAARLGLEAERYATIVHPAAVLAASTTLGPGTVALAGVVTTADVEVGAHVVLMPQVLLTHDDRLDDFVTVGGGVKLAGAVQVKEGAYVGAGSAVREYLTVGAYALVAMGAVVTTDVPAGELWAGCPATFRRMVDG